MAVPLLELLLMGPILLMEALPERPVLGTLVLLLAGLGLAFCYKGARLESPRAVRFLSRFLLLLFTISVALISIEALPVALMAVAMGHGASLEDVLRLIAAVALVCMATAGLKFSLALRVRYWILLIVMFAMVLLVAVAAQVLIFLS
ncbi:MAG TPA: hypothetical protein VF414_16075 [Thermoanaerobaculia bacterium]